jgi:hypothetical protein
MTKKKSKSKIHVSKKKKQIDKPSHSKVVKPLSHEGDERNAHEVIINRRITGGVTMSREEIAEAYISAQEEWLQLPGSIIRSPTDVLLIQKRLQIKDISASSKRGIRETEEGGESP